MLARWSCRTARHIGGCQQMANAVYAAAAAGVQPTEVCLLLAGGLQPCLPWLHGHGLQVCLRGSLSAVEGCVGTYRQPYPLLQSWAALIAERTVPPMASLSPCLLRFSEAARLGSPDHGSD